MKFHSYPKSINSPSFSIHFLYIKLNLVFNIQNFRQWKTQSITSITSTTETSITGTTRTWITNTTTTNLASMTNIIRTCITSITLHLIWYISFLFSACEWCYRRGWCRTNEKVGIIFHYMDLSKYVKSYFIIFIWIVICLPIVPVVLVILFTEKNYLHM